MSMRRRPPKETQRRQLLASDPRRSAWVSANAGSGKTTVLTRRVVRMLVGGVAPSAILCLTFTKAAAANMQNRIFGDLAKWAAMADEKLSEEMEALEGVVPDGPAIARARRLFARAVETPGGLKVLTIHAFCERVLHLFPFEANVPAQFTVLDDRSAGELIEEVRQAILLDANAKPDGVLGRAFRRIVEEAGADSFDELIREVTDRRDDLRAVLEDGGPGAVAERLRKVLSLDPGECVEKIDRAFEQGCIPEEEWGAIARALGACGQKTMTDLARNFASALALPPEHRLESYRAIFLTGKGQPRDPRRFLSAPFRAQHAGLAAALDEELGRIAELQERRKIAACLERTTALTTLADALIRAYEARKRMSATLDFDDLVGKTLDLLRRAGAEWVLYKLDRGIDHILVDEAQDTSPKQWQIVELLASEFASGEGARGGLRRTIFAVGDEKQSIFSFQGAAPAEFARMRGAFRRRMEAAGEPFEAIDLTHSFRSTLDVLSAVDEIFANAATRRGLSSDDAATVHETVRVREPGRVEVWPVIRPEQGAEIEAWDAPFDATPASSAPARAANRIARGIAALIRDGDASTGARFGPGDVMVLVRSRNALFEALIRAFRREGVPVAGADRLVLMDHIAVMDLVALARFTLLPADDLTLASVLKSPLIGLDDDHLMHLAPGRRGSLWEALRGAAEDDAAFRAAFDRLDGWIDEAGFKTPFAFFADLLARDGGRRAFLARLGHEAADALEELLRAAADYERRATPSLEGFLAWLEAARSEIKRDMDVGRGEVRVMTVHGAKGLEARLVVLADTCGAPHGRHDPRLFSLLEEDAAPGRAPVLAWSPGGDADPPCVAQARAAIRDEARAEHRRLLYVALTRAQDRLLITGHEGARRRPAESWYDMIEPALREGGARVEAMPDGDGERLIWERTERMQVTSAPGATATAAPSEPDWLRRTLDEERAHRAPLRPSAVPGDDGSVHREAAERGSLVHRLLQALPDLDPEGRAASARHFLRRIAPDLREPDTLLDEVMAILNDPAFAPVFGPGSRAEVQLIGRIGGREGPDLPVSGRIDRICVRDDEVLIVDFKTSRPVPTAVADVPPAHVRQLALYAALLERLYPDRPVRTALVWTALPLLMPIPLDLLAAALDGI